MRSRSGWLGTGRSIRRQSLVMTILSLMATAVAAGDRSAQDLVDERCALCHGPEGESASAVYPRLSAQHPEYLAKQLKDFREKRRLGSTMNEQTADLNDNEVLALAAYFASKPARGKPVADADLAAVGRFIHLRGNPYSGTPACSSCHGVDGHGTHQLPRLAGQLPSYLELQLKQFNQRARSNDQAVMHSVAAQLTELEIKAVAAYLAGLQ